MTETESADLSSTENGSSDHPSGTGPRWRLDPGLAEGRSKLALFVGLGGLGVGSIVHSKPVFLGSVTLVGFAFVLNTAGKLRHYWELQIPTGAQMKLSVSWLLLGGTVLALLGTYASARYLGGEGGYFWPLAVAGFGFGLLHMVAQSRCLPADADEREGR